MDADDLYFLWHYAAEMCIRDRAIIDQQTFDLAQKIRSNVRRYPNGWGEAAPLLSLIHI